MRRPLVSICLFLLVAAGLTGCGNRVGTAADDTATSTTAQAHRFSMTLDRTQLPPGGQFLATYHADHPGTIIGHGYQLDLSRDGKTINRLNNVEDPREDWHAVDPPDGIINAILEVGPGPYRFVLPKSLDLGAYQACVGLWEEHLRSPRPGETVPRTGEEICVDITVTDEAPTTTPVAPRFSMTLDRTQLAWRTAFFATYYVDDPSLVIRHDYQLYVERDGKPLSVTGGTAPLGMANIEAADRADADDNGRIDNVYDAAVVARLTAGSGPYRFEFPGGVDPGAYQVCGRLWADKDNVRFGEKVCVDITASG